MNTEVIFTAVCAVLTIIIIIYYSKRPNRVLSVLFGTFTGIASLLLLSRYGRTIGLEAMLNPFNLAGSAVLGIPYVIGIAIMNFL